MLVALGEATEERRERRFEHPKTEHHLFDHDDSSEVGFDVGEGLLQRGGRGIAAKVADAAKKANLKPCTSQ